MKKTILYFVIFCSICFEACGDSDKLIRNSANAPQCYIFELKNLEKHRIKLDNIRTSCTCADVKYLKSELQPGESTELIVTLKANSLSGPFTHTIAQSKNFEKRAALAAIKKISNRRNVIR